MPGTLLSNAFTVVALAAGAAAARGQTAAAQAPSAEEAAVQAARTLFTTVGRELSTYRRVERKGTGYLDTVRVVGFYRGKELRKIEIRYFGSDDGVKEELYFDAGQLVFRFRSAPGSDGTVPGTGPTREDRYYFAGGRMVRWVDAEGERIPASYPSYRVAESETLQGLKPVLAALAGPASDLDVSGSESALLHTDWAKSVTLKATKVKNPTLASVLLDGERIDIAKTDDQPLRISLWQVDREHSCGRAGHMICGYQYLLAVSEPGESGDFAVYDLGEFGTVEQAKWLAAQGERAILRVTALNYPAHVFEYWKGLQLERGTFMLSIGTDSLGIRRIKPTR